jgi:hypothetical protein
MTNPLTPARFAELAEAYGSVVARWPEAVRAEAMAIAREPAMQAILAEAEWLDARLDAWRVPAPSPALRDRVVASRRVALLRRARLWWSGIGIATALAGAVAGSVGVAVAMPSDHAIADEATAFGDLTAQEH